MLYVLDTVDVAVDIHITVIGIDGTYQLRVLETEPAVSGYGTVIFLGGDYVVQDVAVIKAEQIARLAGIRRPFRPDGGWRSYGW